LNVLKGGVNKVANLAKKGAAVMGKVAKGQIVVKDRYIDGMWRPRMKKVPGTHIPADPPIVVEYMDPSMTDHLKHDAHYLWPERLQNALNTVTIAANNRIDQIKRQMKWSKQAKSLVSELALKKGKVNAHIAKLTAEVRNFLKKKKQIENKLLQDKLVERLTETHANLKKLRRQTHNIRKHEAKMVHHKEQLAHGIEGILRSLALLKGMKRKRKFPSIGFAQKKLDKLAKFDPDLSFEKEADQVRALSFPDMVLHEAVSEVHANDAKEEAPVLAELQGE